VEEFISDSVDSQIDRYININKDLLMIIDIIQ